VFRATPANQVHLDFLTDPDAWYEVGGMAVSLLKRLSLLCDTPLGFVSVGHGTLLGRVWASYPYPLPSRPLAVLRSHPRGLLDRVEVLGHRELEAMDARLRSGGLLVVTGLYVQDYIPGIEASLLLSAINEVDHHAAVAHIL
jgi:hypothetical protein